MALVMSYCPLGNYAARSHSAEQAPSHTATVASSPISISNGRNLRPVKNKRKTFVKVVDQSAPPLSLGNLHLQQNSPPYFYWTINTF